MTAYDQVTLHDLLLPERRSGIRFEMSIASEDDPSQRALVIFATDGIDDGLTRSAIGWQRLTDAGEWHPSGRFGPGKASPEFRAAIKRAKALIFRVQQRLIADRAGSERDAHKFFELRVALMQRQIDALQARTQVVIASAHLETIEAHVHAIADLCDRGCERRRALADLCDITGRLSVRESAKGERA